MVAQVLAHTGQFVVDLDAHFLQVVRGTHAGQEQQLGRTHGPAAADKLVSFHHEPLAAALHVHANHPVPVKYEPVGRDAGPYRQIQAMPDGVQVGQGCAHADAVGVVHGYGPDTPRIGVVHVGVVGIALGQAGLVEGHLGRQPGLLLVAAHRNGAVKAVEVVVDIRVRLQLAEVGQGLDEGPFVVAPGCPVVVVLGDAPQQHLAVNGAGTAHHAAPGHGHGVALLPGGDAGEGIVVGGVDGGSHLVVAVLQVVGVGLEIGVVRPGLQQQNRAVRVLGQAGSQYAPGRTGPDDYYVILHKSLPWSGVVIGLSLEEGNGR